VVIRFQGFTNVILVFVLEPVFKGAKLLYVVLVDTVGTDSRLFSNSTKTAA